MIHLKFELKNNLRNKVIKIKKINNILIIFIPFLKKNKGIELKNNVKLILVYKNSLLIKINSQISIFINHKYSFMDILSSFYI